MDAYDNSKKVIIDPWVINPNFTPNNKAYDVDYDFSGNVYVSGMSSNPIMSKYTNTGTLLWTYTIVISGSGWVSYGGLAIDRVTENAYIAYDITSTSRILKLNNTGIPVQSVIANAKEIWRIVYNQCTNQLICGGGNMFYSNTDAQLVSFDSNLGSENTYVVESNKTDVTSFTLSKDGSSLFYLSTYNNTPPFPQLTGTAKFHKLSVSDLSTLSYLFDSGYLLSEGSSTPFYSPASSLGYNGITASKYFVYTYDGYEIKKWNQQNGTLISTLQIMPTVLWDPAFGNMANNVIKIQWAGIDVDECENIYVGFNNTIQKYDANLSLISTISLPDVVYDVMLSDHNTIYACGKSFVGEYSLTPPSPLSMEHTDPTNCDLCDATATVIGICPDGIDNFSFSWNTTPVQTNDTATNLCPGTYTVTVTKNGCNPTVYYTGTVTIAGSTGPTIVTALTSTISGCIINDGTASVTATGGTPPFSYSWNTTPVQTTQTVTGLPSGMILVSVTDAVGCIKNDSIVVPSQNTLELTMSSIPISCLTDEGVAAVSVSGGTPVYSYAWSNGNTNSSTNVSSSGNYYVTVTDAGGCISTDSIFVTPPAVPVSTAGSNSPVCEGSSINLTATNSSISGSTYSWTGPNGFISTVQNPVITPSTLFDSGTYTLIVTANDCSDTSNVSVVVLEMPIATASVNTPICVGEQLNLTGGSQLANSTYQWSGPNNFTSSMQNPVIANAPLNAAGPYIVSVTVNGCSASDTVNAVVNPVPTTIAISNSPICAGDTLKLEATANTISGSTYIWSGPLSYASTNQNPFITPATAANSGIYSVITSANGCVDTSTVAVVVNAIPVANFSADILKGCIPLEVVFTNLSNPNSDSLLWNFGDGSVINTINDIITHTYTVAGDYTISLTTFTAGCSNTITHFQMIHAADNAVAKFNANPTETTIFDPEIHFTNLSSNATTYFWNFGDNTTSTVTNPSHIYTSEPGDFNVQLIANNGDNCPDTTVVTIIIIEPLLFYVPNTFTPDGNSFNELFVPIMTSGFDSTSYSIQIYNRWGEIIFETKDAATGWDGKYKGEVVQDGTYTWLMIFKNKQTDKMYRYKGHVNVLR